MSSFVDCKMSFKIIIFLYLLLQVHEMKSENYSVSDIIGTTLFEDHGFPKKCFSQEDIALLSTRLKFQVKHINNTHNIPKRFSQFKTLLPTTDNPHLEEDKTIEATIKYLYSVNELISIMTATQIRDFVQKSYYDMLGG